MTVPPEWAGGVGRWIGTGSNLEIGEVLAKTGGIKFSMPAFCCRFGAAACAAVGGCGGHFLILPFSGPIYDVKIDLPMYSIIMARNYMSCTLFIVCGIRFYMRSITAFYIIIRMNSLLIT